MAATATKADIEAQLAQEAIDRPRGAYAALASALFSVAGAAYSASALGDQPASSMLGELSSVEKPGAIGALHSQRAELFDYYSSHKFALLFGALLLGLAALGAGFALRTLQSAVRARAERFPAYGRHLPLIGALVVFAGSLLSVIGTIAYTDSALGTVRTVDAISDVSRGFLTFGLIIVQFGGLVLAGAYIVTALHAMRCGLLPRAWGIIGIFAGVMVVLPVAALSQLIQPVWLLVLALIFLGRYPGGAPPAWAAGVALPWPSAAEEARAKREEREGKQPSAPKRAIAAPPSADDVEARAAAKPHPSSKKRKRKKRA
ncbi:MAG: hypothetical protein QOF76_2708 [Solirubrobacteraceae bacterium]|jgi:hypothetical protein|nr:hypothetical protein [Solirubrobacteraceae bacterium]